MVGLQAEVGIGGDTKMTVNLPELMSKLKRPVINSNNNNKNDHPIITHSVDNNNDQYAINDISKRSNNDFFKWPFKESMKPQRNFEETLDNNKRSDDDFLFKNLQPFSVLDKFATQSKPDVYVKNNFPSESNRNFMNYLEKKNSVK